MKNIMSEQSILDLFYKYKENLNLDLKNKTIYTEAASGSYIYNSLFAAFCGASHVFAETKDSSYASAKKVIDISSNLAEKLNLSKKITFLNSRNHEALSRSDIVTNSGFVRPLDRDLIDQLGPRTVIPLMWETWEFREDELDLDYCKKKSILVMGTNENREPVDMKYYSGLLALKFFFHFDFKLGKILLLGSPENFAKPMIDYFKRINICALWASNEAKSDLKYKDLKNFLKKKGNQFTTIIVADHNQLDVIGPKGFISGKDIFEANPNLKVGIIAGGVSVNDLKRNSVEFFPKKIRPKGYMSYQPYVFGPEPVLKLFSGGLKVGQEMSKARHAGLSCEEAAKIAITKSPAMDFTGKLSWIR